MCVSRVVGVAFLQGFALLAHAVQAGNDVYYPAEERAERSQIARPLLGGSKGDDANANAIKPYAKNPRYWQYKGQPVLLLGGTKDDNLFQIPDLKEHLDMLQRVGGNYIRNTMSSRRDGGFEVQAFKKLANRKYDLEQWNDRYWIRFENLLRWTHERDIIMQIEIWAFHDFNQGRWEENPWRPANTISYSTSNTRLKDHYGNIGRVSHDFFFSVPKLNNDRVLLGYQQRFVDKLLSFSLQYDHVLYCMTNEIHRQFSPEWGWYWADYVREKAAANAKNVYTTEMFWQTDLKAEQQRASLDHPKIHNYFEASQNSARSGQENWDNLQFVYERLSGNPRPINHVKIYGADTGPHWAGTQRDALERFWRNVFGGSAASRFHRPATGIGLNEAAQAHIKSMRLLTEELDIFSCLPDSRSRLIAERSENEAYLTRIPGRQYAVYLPAGGSVRLDLSDADGPFTAKWLDISNSRWRTAERRPSRRAATLDAPSDGHWVVLLTKGAGR